MILGIIGGILGMIISALVIIAGVAMRFASTMVPSKANIPLDLQGLLPVFGNMAAGRGIGALIFSIIGLIAAIVVKKKGQMGGILMLISGIVGFVFLLVGFIVPGILFILGGILALVNKDTVAK